MSDEIGTAACACIGTKPKIKAKITASEKSLNIVCFIRISFWILLACYEP